MSLVRLYGRAVGNGSLAVVFQGFRGVLEAEGLLAGTSAFEVEDASEESLGEEGASAPVGLWVGPPELAHRMMQSGNHRRHFIMVTPNSTRLPASLVNDLNRLRAAHDVTFLSPSAWASFVVDKELELQEDLTITVPHGVDAAYRPRISAVLRNREEAAKGAFRVLHLSTSARARKGTVELIEAWGKFSEYREKSELCCVMDFTARSALIESLADQGIALPSSARLVDRMDLPHESMARVLSSAHVVCQPSRGEGFGLIPLQALACGVPVIATAVTGHQEYLRRGTPGAVEVKTGELAPIDDQEGSLAPALAPKAIQDALFQAHREWQELQIEAVDAAWDLKEGFSWSAQLEGFVDILKGVGCQ